MDDVSPRAMLRATRRSSRHGCCGAEYEAQREDRDVVASATAELVRVLMTQHRVVEQAQRVSWGHVPLRLLTSFGLPRLTRPMLLTRLLTAFPPNRGKRPPHADASPLANASVQSSALEQVHGFQRKLCMMSNPMYPCWVIEGLLELFPDAGQLDMRHVRGRSGIDDVAREAPRTAPITELNDLDDRIECTAVNLAGPSAHDRRTVPLAKGRLELARKHPPLLIGRDAPDAIRAKSEHPTRNADRHVRVLAG